MEDPGFEPWLRILYSSALYYSEGVQVIMGLLRATYSSLWHPSPVGDAEISS